MVQQRDENWLKSASPEEIYAAQRAGNLANLLGTPVDSEQEAAQANESSDEAAARALGLTLAQFQQIESLGSLRKIAETLAAKGQE